MCMAFLILVEEAPQAAFGIVPAGTGGDFIKSLGVPRDTFAAAAALKSPPRAIDVGRLRYVGDDGRPAVRHFINIASFGIGGLVDRYVNDGSKALGGKLSFAVATLKAGAAYKNASVRLILDGGTPKEGKIYNVAVANGRYFGGGMHVAPHAQVDDGRFEVIALDAPSKLAFAVFARRIYDGSHLTVPGVQRFACDRLTLDLENEDARSAFLLDVDGEPLGGLPLEVDVVPGALRMLD